jgi:transcriptional regulator with XRE-family HTH domain
MDDRTLGRRIAYWRVRRNLTQRVFADRIGRSLSWVCKVEVGERSADRLSVLDTICEVLRIDLSVLIGEEPTRGRQVCIDDVQVERIRHTLEQYSINDAADDRLDPDALRRQIDHAWSAFEFADYDVISLVLPALLRQAQRVHASFDTETSAALLAEVYEITASTLRKLGEHSLSWLAADRGIALAQRIGNLSMVAATGFRIANALLSMGRAQQALDLNLSLANRLEPQRRSEEDHALYGHVLLQGAMAAAATDNAATVDDLVGEAADAAQHVSPRSNHHRLSFGTANVGLHQVSALIALGESGRAIEAATAIEPTALAGLRKERRTALLVDVARAHSHAGQYDKALRCLLSAEKIAPREVRCRPVTQATIADLLRRTSSPPSAELIQIAQRADVNV